MLDIAWCDKYDLSVLCLLYFINSLTLREHLPHLLLQKIIICCILQKKKYLLHLYDHHNRFLWGFHTIKIKYTIMTSIL